MTNTERRASGNKARAKRKISTPTRAGLEEPTTFPLGRAQRTMEKVPVYRDPASGKDTTITRKVRTKVG